MPSNTYEFEMDRLLSASHPEYYSALQQVISEFEEGLIVNEILQDPSFESYQEVLKNMSKGYEFTVETEFDPNGTLDEWEKGLLSTMISHEGIIIATKYLKTQTSKSKKFHQRVSDLREAGKGITRAGLAEIYLEVYEADDLHFPLVKMKLCKFLDPNSDFLYIYLDKPGLD